MAKKETEKSTQKKESNSEINIGAFEEVKIGNQVWMAKNLDVTHFRNGDPIPEAKTVKEWLKAGKNKQPAWCYYDNKESNGKKYGKLYNWFAVTDSRILTPKGYHVPSHEEWDTLLANLGGDFSAGGKLKEKGTKNWNSPNSKATNQSNFSALPGGYCFAEDGFLGVTEKASFWSKSEFKSNLAKERTLINSTGSVILSYRDKRQGSTVRGIKDADELVKGIKLGSLEIYKCDIGSFSFNDAKLECEKIGGGWRVPTKDELNILFENKESIGQFTDGFYWSSTKDESSVSFAWGQRFEDGFQNICSSTAKFKNFIRPVRSI
jgi:uncharacterized protein (TIGR02145 family)